MLPCNSRTVLGVTFKSLRSKREKGCVCVGGGGGGAESEGENERVCNETLLCCQRHRVTSG